MNGPHDARNTNPDAAPGDRPVRVLELRAADGAGGGPEKTILAGALQRRDDGVSVQICYIRSATDPDFVIGATCRAAGVRYHEVVQRSMTDVGILGRIRDIVRRERIDLVHSHDYKSDLAALYVGSREPVVPLATAHGWTGHSARERWLYYPLNKLTLTCFPYVIAVSSEIRGRLIRWGARADRVGVVLNGIDPHAWRRDPGKVAPARRRFGVPPGRVVLGAVGRLEPQKRFDLLLHSLAVLRVRRPELLLLIAGEGSQRAALERMIIDLGLQSHCRLLGQVRPVADLYHAFDVFVQSSDYEGTANVLLEAMALEVPVVATDAGGSGELIGDGLAGRLVPRGSVTALTTAIGQTLDDQAETAWRTAQGRRRVETDLSFDHRTDLVHAVYRRLVGRVVAGDPVGVAA